MTKKQKKQALRIIVAVVLLAAVFVIQKTTDLKWWLYLLMYLVPYFIAGYDVLFKSVRNIAHGQVFDECFLMALATLGALAVGEYPESVFVMVFYQIGELFQGIAVGKSRKSISALMDICPESANVIRNGEVLEVFPDEVQTGESLLVRPGEKIPIDGEVLQGQSSIDTSALTGESVPTEVSAGQRVISGCVNLTGTLTIKTTCTYENSSVAKILELVENSSLNKSKSENFITKFAKYYTPCVVIGALLLALVPGIITGDFKNWIYRALIFLVVSCPCALVISVPLTFFGGIGHASAKGILVKGANYLEAAADAKTVIFDKTGTLTNGCFSVVDVLPEEGFTREKVLTLAGTAEYHSLHPLAKSIKNACDRLDRPDDITELAGFGVKASINGDGILVGNAALMQKQGIAVKQKADACTSVYVAFNGCFAGEIRLSDTPKTNAAQAIRMLKACGVQKCVMLSGDREQTAMAVGKALGIDEIHAGLLPEEKVRETQKICADKPKKHTVMYVGDGINDAPVLGCADVGIAMGALGCDAAVEASDIVITDDDITKVFLTVKIAKRTKRIVRENVVFALVVKFAVLILSALGFTQMWLGVLADVGVAVLAILNAMRMLKTTHRD